MKSLVELLNENLNEGKNEFGIWDGPTKKPSVAELKEICKHIASLNDEYACALFLKGLKREFPEIEGELIDGKYTPCLKILMKAYPKYADSVD